jgi:hypothetical protein
MNAIPSARTMSTSNNTKLLKTRDQYIRYLINFGFLAVFILIAAAIYLIFFNKSDKIISRFEAFQTQSTISSIKPLNLSKFDSVYEEALSNIYGTNARIICSVTPGMAKNGVCTIENDSYIVYNFPVQMIKLLDGTILAVFNDGRLYKKDNMFNTMWQGPLSNSLIGNTIPLRMVTLTPRLDTLLGVGYNNKLYMKKPNRDGGLDLTATWQMVPNNSDIIYVLFDRATGSQSVSGLATGSQSVSGLATGSQSVSGLTTGNMISITTKGKLSIKSTSDITSNNNELVTLLDRPVIKLFYDLNGYMLALDNNLDLYQFSELDWKTSSLNMQRGANDTKLLDILYHNDGRLFGLSVNTKAFMVQTLKQADVFYLSDFATFEQSLNLENKESFVMSDQDIIKSKVGNIDKYLAAVNENEESDDDPNIAYQKQLFDTRAKLKQFCATRNSTTKTNVDNYELLANVEDNADKINQLKSIVQNIIKYEPDKTNIINQYPILTQN